MQVMINVHLHMPLHAAPRCKMPHLGASAAGVDDSAVFEFPETCRVESGVRLDGW
jgi:hypothetical protein